MKIMLPPIVAILFTIAFDKTIDLIFNLGPYDESGTPGLVFFIEAIILSSSIAIGFLFHWLLVSRLIDHAKEKGYLKAFGWGLFMIILIIAFYILIIEADLNYPLLTKTLNALRLFSTLLIFLFIDIYSFKLIKKHRA